jgi:chromosome segregation ATPase
MAEKASLADRRANALQGEMEEARALLDSAERGKRQTEAELAEARSAVNEMNTINSKAGNEKRHLEGAVHTMHAEIDDMLQQAKNSEEKAKKAMVDAARLADELRAEQDHVNTQVVLNFSNNSIWQFFLNFIFSGPHWFLQHLKKNCSMFFPFLQKTDLCCTVIRFV